MNETHLDSTVSDSNLQVPGYTIYRRDRNLNGGGVCFYIQSALTALPLNSTATPAQPEVESLHVLITVGTRRTPLRFLLTSTYRPPSSTVRFWEQFSTELDRIATAHPTACHIVMGDFNTNVLSSSSHHYRHLQQLCTEHCIRNIVSCPTRFPSNTCLDLVLIAETVKATTPAVVDLGDLTDHSLVKVDIGLGQCEMPPTHTFYNIRKPALSSVDQEKFQTDLHCTLRAHPDLETLDSMVDYFTESIHKTVDKHAPMKRVLKPNHRKPKPQPWVTPDLAKLLQHRRILNRRSRSRPHDLQLRQQYQSVRREGKLANKRMKSAYLIKKFKALKNNPKKQWSLLNSLAGRQSTRHQPRAPLPELTDTFGAIVHDATRPLALQAPTQPNGRDPGLPTLAAFSPVSVETVHSLLKGLNANKCAGSDGILPSTLKQSHEKVAPFLTDIINDSLSTGIFPSKYKIAHICPVFKTGDPTQPSNYRPISLLPVCSKILEKIVLQQLLTFFKSQKIQYIPDEQFAYRAQHSCEDALVLATERWRKALDQNLYCGVVLADLSKAFDRVQHSELISQLHSLGLREATLNWMTDYLTNRSQVVTVAGELGDTRPCTRGVPQGSVLGPLLFCIYIRDAPACFSHSVNQQFADDIAFHVIDPDANIIATKLSADIQNLDSYLVRKGLLLNPAKTNFLLLRRQNKPLPDNITLRCRDVSIEPCQSARYLGVTVDQHLTFQEHVENVCLAAHQKTGAFRHNRRNLSLHARRLFYLSIIQSTLEYGSSAFVHSLTQDVYNKLITTSHLTLKKIFSLDRRTSTALVHNTAKVYTLEQRVNLKTYVFIYRCLNGLISPLLQSLFVPQAAGHRSRATTRGQTTAALILPAANSRIGFHCVSFLGADRWNSLPADCRTARSPSEFVSHVKSFLGFPVIRH